MIPIAVHIIFLSLYAVLFFIIFVQNGTVRDDLNDVRSDARLQRHNRNDLIGRVAQLESDYRSLISKPTGGTRVTVRSDRSNPMGDRPDVAKMKVGCFDMSKIKAVTVPPEEIFSFQKHPQVTVSMLDEASYIREFGGQRDTGEITITIGVKHD